MRYSTLLLLSVIFASCNTAKINGNDYKTSSDNVEIGSIGFSKSTITENDFMTRSFPKLENKLRVGVVVTSFNKKYNKVYQKKAKANQRQEKIQYADSLAVKPELVTISILDIAGFINEINANNNKDVLDFLMNTEKSKIVTSVVTTLSQDNIAQISQADTYYLINTQASKYTLALYKGNKKTEVIDLQSGIVLGYGISKCCWTLNGKGKWYLADLVDEHSACRGKTFPKIKKKERTKSLYRM